jgi:hypothetical protein
VTGSNHCILDYLGLYLLEDEIMVGVARLAGHKFLSMPSRNLEVITPNRNMRDYIPQSAGSNPAFDDLILHQVAQYPTKPIEIVGSKQVAMQDWDWPDDGHIAKNAITVNNLGDVYESMNRFTTDNPDELWRMYVTPGGVRAFDMASQRPAYKAFDLQGQLNSDPLYAQLTDNTGFWGARISPKMGREGDFVALPIGQMGTGQRLPSNVDYIKRFHDVPILENRVVNDQAQIPESAFALLEKQAGTLPSTARGMIDPLLSQIYGRLR